ncbi:hypothetical protein F0562_032573 [Nyssa sinensis]|uniref:Uncharacterized protein n=1 Tax=Nyssa sinensis TaxID=561372 RepID=A0A5J5AUE4_9ASTE|nr:hypothetical protein F0562_032573 [Nyssa sinensis]
MGNYISFSCTLISPTMKSSKAARVILPGGEIRQFREPVKAAELMLESPNYFIVNSRSLNIGRRFSALAADEDLEFGNVYIMFPMKRVNSIVTAADMAVFFMAANVVAKRLPAGKVKISPEGASTATSTSTSAVDDSRGSEVGRSRLDLDDVEGFPLPEFKYSFNWKLEERGRLPGWGKRYRLASSYFAERWTNSRYGNGVLNLQTLNQTASGQYIVKIKGK